MSRCATLQPPRPVQQRDLRVLSWIFGARVHQANLHGGCRRGAWRWCWRQVSGRSGARGHVQRGGAILLRFGAGCCSGLAHQIAGGFWRQRLGANDMHIPVLSLAGAVESLAASPSVLANPCVDSQRQEGGPNGSSK